MEIEEIQISLILDQYLEWMNQQQELNLEVASEFVAMAAHLVYIKTRMLLSIQDEEAASEMEELIASLEARRRSENYGKICQVTTLLSGRYEMGCDYITKPPEVLKPAETYQYRHQPGTWPKQCRACSGGPGRKCRRLPPHLKGLSAGSPIRLQRRRGKFSADCCGPVWRGSVPCFGTAGAGQKLWRLFSLCWSCVGGSGSIWRAAMETVQ